MGYDVTLLTKFNTQTFLVIEHYLGGFSIIDTDIYETYLMLCKNARLYSEYRVISCTV